MNEDTEVLRVTLRNADNAQLAGGGATLSAAGRIEDEDPLPGLSLGNGSLTEGAGGGSMRFEVRLKPASGRTVTVQYGTADVTATGGSDYTPVSGTLYAAARRCCASTARPAPPDGGPSGASAGAAAHRTGDSVRSRHQSPPRRHIPAAVRRHVWLRDGGRCCYRDPLTGVPFRE